MTKLHIFFFGLVLLASTIVIPAQASALTLAEKASIQASMQRHVDGQLVDGALLYLNQKAGEVQRLHPVTAHPMILTMGDHYVLCFDFRNDSGKNVPVDYYMARRDSEYVVFHTAVADRTLLKRLMSDGKIARLR
ncbi:hypothetical protein [Nisaea nitritireducens]|uniref:hypothetical protein n=1 Tax=Nisaea nitritireducens TaxID=568392 RepID=UPI001868A967|nr:hypothetical protein [Nisaea nitritireducens]